MINSVPVREYAHNCLVRPGLARRLLKGDPAEVEHHVVSSPRTSDPAFSRALEAARMGQAPGFEWLWNRFSRQVSVFAAAQGSSDPEGITNDVFLGAFRRVDTFFGNEDGFVSLLFSIARNKLVDEHRKQTRQVPTSDSDLYDEPSGGDVENDALRSLGVEAAALLEGLTDEQSEVLHLRLIADLSIEQTALVTGRSVNAVKALQHRATNSLRRTISEEAVTK